MVKNLLASAGDPRDVGLIPRLGGCPGREHGNPLQYSCLENPMGRGAWWATFHRFAKSWTRFKQLSSSSSSLINYLYVRKRKFCIELLHLVFITIFDILIL